jgi:dTDP-4-dehydrorhamnose reductase
MRILVTGSKGKLGSVLVNLLSKDHELTGLSHDDLDITKRLKVMDYIKSFEPELVINTAALTNVDYCAENPDHALLINGYGVKNLALACQAVGAELLQISTNEVFDGTNTKSYLEYDSTHPINAYGYSKWVAERIILDLIPKHYIVRTSWLFAHGGKNFIQAILNRAETGQSVRVVVNEVANPTYTNDLAEAVVKLIETQAYGVYHLVNEGRASRWTFARHILDISGHKDVPIERISSYEYQRSSTPPEYAVLRNFAAKQLGINLRNWQDAVDAFLQAEMSIEGNKA